MNFSNPYFYHLPRQTPRRTTATRVHLKKGKGKTKGKGKSGSKKKLVKKEDAVVGDSSSTPMAGGAEGVAPATGDDDEVVSIFSNHSQDDASRLMTIALNVKKSYPPVVQNRVKGKVAATTKRDRFTHNPRKGKGKRESEDDDAATRATKKQKTAGKEEKEKKKPSVVTVAVVTPRSEVGEVAGDDIGPPELEFVIDDSLVCAGDGAASATADTMPGLTTLAAVALASDDGDNSLSVSQIDYTSFITDSVSEGHDFANSIYNATD